MNPPSVPPPLPSPLLNGELLQFTRPSPFSLPPEPRPAAGEAAAPKIRILVAEDDAVARELICTRLENWGYEAVPTQNGTDAIMALRRKNAPVLAVIDWMMPGMDGLEICRRVREVNRVLYVILLTSRSAKENVIEGLGAGADDYLIKPFDKEELQARILVGLRVMALQTALAVRVNELEAESIASNGWR